MAYIPSSGSIVAYQITPSSLLTGASIIGLTPVAVTNTPSISGTINIAGTPSISGTVNIGTIPGSVVSYPLGTIVTSLVSTVPSSVIVGASIFGQLPGGTAPLGSVAALQGTNPWIITGSVQGNIGGSVVAFQGGAWSTSVIGATVQGQGAPSASIVGNPVYIGGKDANGSVIGAKFSASNEQFIIGSVSGTVNIAGNPSISGTVNIAGNPSISGAINANQVGAWNVSIVSTIPSSVIIGSSIFGQLPSGTATLGSVVAYQGVIPWTIGSVYGNISGSVVVANTTPSSMLVGSSIFGQLPAGTAPIGSVAVLQGTLPWAIAGSVAAIQTGQSGTVITSISGTVSVMATYAEDAGHTSADPGLFTLAVRNDTLASITSTDLDYSPNVVGPSGELVVANAPLTKWVSGVASVMYGVSQPIIVAQGASVFTYVTGVQLANLSGSSVLVAFLGGVDSVIGYTIAPVGGGSNIYFPNALKTRQNAAFSGSVSGTASVYLSAQGFISKS